MHGTVCIVGHEPVRAESESTHELRWGAQRVALCESTRSEGQPGSGVSKRPVRSTWIAAAALGRAKTLGYPTELLLPTEYQCEIRACRD